MHACYRYAISRPSEYLVLTGAGIDDIKICKKALVMPWQRVWLKPSMVRSNANHTFEQFARISVAPYDFSLSLQAMTIEKLQFSLPAVFTIGPDNERAALRKYALLLSGCAEEASSAQSADLTDQARHNHVQDIVRGIIEGETRVIVSSMSMEEIFKERQVFKTKGRRWLADWPGHCMLTFEQWLKMFRMSSSNLGWECETKAFVRKDDYS